MLNTTTSPTGAGTVSAPSSTAMQGKGARILAAIPATATALHRDATLIAVSAEYIDLERRIAETPEPDGHATSAANAAWIAATEPLYRRQTELRDYMEDTPATTLDGLRAKAAALRIWLPTTSCGDDLYRSEDGLTWSLIKDILGG